MAPIELEEYFEISGPVEPVRGADVGAEESGTVRAVLHDKGGRVEAGDVLIELDRRLLKADMESARARRDLQVFNAERVARLYEAGKVSEYEKLNAESVRDQAVAAAEAAAVRYERCAVPAPFGGLVADRYVEPGELVAAGTMVARVIDPYTLKLVGTVTEREVPWLREGAPAEVTLDGHEGTVVGRVAWVGFEADTASGKFKTEIHIDNPDLALRSGVVGRARIHKRTHAGVLAVPRDAVLAESGVAQVYVVDGDRARLRTVELGPDQGLMVVVAAGLDEGDLIVVRGQRELLDGALVKVTERTDAADGTMAGDPAEVTAGAASRKDVR